MERINARNFSQADWDKLKKNGDELWMYGNHSDNNGQWYRILNFKIKTYRWSNSYQYPAFVYSKKGRNRTISDLKKWDFYVGKPDIEELKTARDFLGQTLEINKLVFTSKYSLPIVGIVREIKQRLVTVEMIKIHEKLMDYYSMSDETNLPCFDFKAEELITIKDDEQITEIFAYKLTR